MMMDNLGFLVMKMRVDMHSPVDFEKSACQII